MTPRLAMTIAADHYVARLRVAPRCTITAVIIGGYLGGVAAATGGLLLAGIRIEREALMTSPTARLGRLLHEVIPPKYRKYVYAVIALAAAAWMVYEATGGDWVQFVGGLIVTLSSATAASNTPEDHTTAGTDYTARHGLE